MSTTEKLSVAALIGVILRRRINRTIDVKWLVENEDYAHEIIRLSREQKLEDLNEYADHLEKLMFGNAKPTTTAAFPPTKSVAEAAKADIHDWLKEAEPEPEEEEEAMPDASKYIGGLR